MGFFSAVAAALGSKAASAIIPSAISSGANLLGSSSSAVKQKREAQRQRNWQEEMSNTSHQRAVEDLRNAGLNEILAATDGATTPGGGMASTPDMGNKVNLLEALNSAYNWKIQEQTADAQTKMADTNEAVGQSTIAMQQAQKAKAEAEKLEIEKRTGLITPETMAKIEQINSAIELNEILKEKNATETTAIKGGKLGYIGGRAVENLETNAKAIRKTIKTIIPALDLLNNR